MSSFYPAAVMSYTDLASLDGLDRPTDYGSGVEYADGVLGSLFPESGVGIQVKVNQLYIRADCTS